MTANIEAGVPSTRGCRRSFLGSEILEDLSETAASKYVGTHIYTFVGERELAKIDWKN